MSTNNATVDRIQAVWSKLGGECGVSKFLAGQLVVGLAPHVKNPVWTTIELGHSPSGSKYREALTRAGVGPKPKRGYDPISPIPIVSGKPKVKLARVKPKDLGFDNAEVWEKVIRRAELFGYQLCPAEVAPALALQYVQSEKNKPLLIAMEAIPWTYFDVYEIPKHSECIFSLHSNEEGSLMDPYYWSPELRVHVYQELVFVVP